MVNCTPETVSATYDSPDRLYSEPLTAEDVIEIVRVEGARGRLLGVIVQLGGQTPLNLAKALERARIPILGTSPDAIDLAEDRQRFQQLLKGLGLRQPDNGTAYSPEEAEAIAQDIGYPVVIRPSYVLGRTAMSTCSRSIRAPRAPCRSSPRRPACRSPRSRHGSWPAKSWQHCCRPAIAGRIPAPTSPLGTSRSRRRCFRSPASRASI